MNNVLLIVIDSLRPDKLSCYGYDRLTSPNIDLMAHWGTIFLRARGGSKTTHGIARIFSGRLDYPTHELHRCPLPSPILTDIFEHHFLFSANDIISYVIPNYYGRVAAMNATEIVDNTIATLNNIRAGWLGILWFMEVHNYPQLNLLTGEYNNPQFSFKNDVHKAIYMNAAYEYGIHIVDAELGRLFQNIDQNDTAIIITADHGEVLDDPNCVEHWTHAGALFHPVWRIPLIVVPPVPQRFVHMCVESHEEVGLVDIFTTICDFMGDPPPVEIQGRSLAYCSDNAKEATLTKLKNLGYISN